MFGHRFYGAGFWGPRYFGPGAAIPTETSGGWRPRLPHWPREESEDDRDTRIHAERVRMGIVPLPADEEEDGPAVVVAAPQAPALPWASLSISLSTLASEIEARDAALRLAGLYTSVYIDAEIARHFREQDDDDEAVLLIAIAATLRTKVSGG